MKENFSGFSPRDVEGTGQVLNYVATTPDHGTDDHDDECLFLTTPILMV